MKVVENVEPKKKRKNYNRNRKKNWRHKIQLDDIENALVERRREEMHGGILGERPFDDLFTLDSNDTAAQPAKKKAISLPNKGSKSKPQAQNSLKKRNKEAPSQGLKCQEFLSGLPGVKPISRGGHLMKQRVPRTLAHATKASKDTPKGKKLHKALQKNKQKNLAQKKLKQTSKDFKKDMWQKEEENKQLEKKYGKWGKSYLQPALEYYKVKRGLNQVKRPVFHFVKPSKLPVNNPHPGLSYNPSLKDHKNLIRKAMAEEKREEKKMLKFKKLEDEMIQNALNKPSKEEKNAELFSGLPEEFLGKPAPSKESSDDEQDKVTCTARPMPRRKTKKDRIKALRTALNKKLERRNEARKLIEDGLNNLDNLVKEIDRKELKAQKKKQRRANFKKYKEPFITKRLALARHKKEPVCLPTFKNLTGSVRTLEPIGSQVVSNVKNKERRNVIVPLHKRNLSRRPVKEFQRSGRSDDLSQFVKEMDIKI